MSKGDGKNLFAALDRKPVLKAPCKGHFIGIFQFATEGNATGNGSYTNVDRLKFFPEYNK